MNLNAKTYVGYLVILRLWIGYYLLQQGTLKFLGDFPHRDWIRRQIGDVAEIDLFPWYKSFLVNVVVPNKELFGYLVTYGEMLVGLCLIRGLLTRFSSAVGAFMMANYILGPGMARGRSSSRSISPFQQIQCLRVVE